MPSLNKVLPVSLLEPNEGRLAKLSSLAGFLAVTFVLYWVGIFIYRLWFHPLAKFPGPAWLAVSDLPFLFQDHILGTFGHRILDLHRRYGSIVRIGANRLAVDGIVGWVDIFAHRPGGDATEFRKVPGHFFPGDNRSLLGAATKDDHRRQRRALAHAFSEAAMYEQEPIITYYVDLFIQRLSETSTGGKPVNMLNWLNFVTFDIIGDLALGDSFRSLETSDYHFWVKNIFNFFKGNNRRRFFLQSGLTPLMALDPDGTVKANKDNRAYSNEKSLARIKLGAEPAMPSTTGLVGVDGKPKMTVRRDFMTYMMRQTSDGKEGLAMDELQNNATTLILAGSETTGTNLATLFFLLSHPQNRVYRDAAVAEVRALFARESDVNLRSVQADALPFLHACIEEALRLHPPVVQTPPRVSPGAMVNGQYVPKGTVLTIYQNATYHNPDNFVEPESFRPERFLPAGHSLHEPRFAAGDKMEAFKPFSHGPRDCIGKNLAYAEMRLIAARVLLRFDIELADGMREDWLNQRIFGIWEKPPLILKLTERTDLELKGR